MSKRSCPADVEESAAEAAHRAELARRAMEVFEEAHLREEDDVSIGVTC